MRTSGTCRPSPALLERERRKLIEHRAQAGDGVLNELLVQDELIVRLVVVHSDVQPSQVLDPGCRRLLVVPVEVDLTAAMGNAIPNLAEQKRPIPICRLK